MTARQLHRVESLWPRRITEGIPRPPHWSHLARCLEVDGDVFFPENGDSTQAKKICRFCEVRKECLEYALENNERYGVYGGLGERERRNLRKKRGQETAA